MKKWLKISLIGVGILILIAVIYAVLVIFFLNYRPTPTYPELDETTCIIDEDCTLSTNHPNYEREICVNKAWQDEWDKNPESENYAVDCIAGVLCTGPEFVATGFRMPENCRCLDNHCQPADLTNYPGCQWAEC